MNSTDRLVQLEMEKLVLKVANRILFREYARPSHRLSAFMESYRKAIDTSPELSVLWHKSVPEDERVPAEPQPERPALEVMQSVYP